MKTFIINRYKKEEKQTLGELIVKDEKGEEIYSCKTLELSWKDNQRNISCIPKGEYFTVIHESPKFGKCFWLQNVPNRSEILIHRGNFYDDILGCILVGQEHADIDGDGYRDVTSSSKTVKELLDLVDKDVLTVHINNNFF